MAITLTESAAKHINHHLSKNDAQAMRLSVRLTGCSGMAYKWDYVSAGNEGDQVFEEHGITVYVDPKALPFIDGTEIDFVREGLSSSFKFHNPNEAASCGCGESFTI
ncbi:iron-sulfur cluster assembly accessory protein [Alcaligenaceae bacterium 429]|uniref:HesB/IscA family protein n=1 Tax=Paenalcaligenes sp. Me52 TaxID=3392038 RepID=UPI001091D454|nr:iron-sulfur cluster assembly accessory protein [Alcaligenaceae bacterium 429]